MIPPAELTSTFRREGFVVVEGLVPGPMLASLQRAADRAMDDERARLLRGDARFVPVSQLDDRYVVTGFVDRDPEVRAFVLGAELAGLCRATIGEEAFLFSDTFVCKAPHSQNGWIWHQDASYLEHLGCGHYPTNLSVWVALDDMTSENGALRVLPFTTLDVRAVVPHDLDKPWTSPDVVDFGTHEGVLLEVPAGSVIAFDGALPHASEPNRTDRPRRALLVQYSRVPVEKDGKLVQRAVPLLRGGTHVTPGGGAS